MVTKAEITDGIRAGMNRVTSTFVQLTDDQLDTQIHDGDRGWTARQILAHLAGRQETYDMMIALAERSTGSPTVGFDIDVWNDRIVESRDGRSREQLLNEFRRVHEQLIQRVEVMPDDHLNRDVVLPSRETTLGNVLLGSGGMHSIQHAEEIEQALGLHN